ncbi:MAG: response regulator [Candidatus Latescibacterota bacterium]|nr:MAG: response regulator [Candidatus Latescibacterota bacterium]
MTPKTILAVDDEEDILELVDYNLSKEGFDVVRVTSGEQALEVARTGKPHLILLDLMLPGLDGLNVCKRLKADSKTADIPIVMLTAKGEETDIVLGLELGAEDYITKPFSPKVLVARVRAVLRRESRSEPDDKAPIVIEEVEIHPGRHEVVVAGKPVHLTFTEYEILYYLARRPGWVFTRYQIVEAVRGDDYAVTDRSVDVQIVGLRKKLGKYGRLIETVRGVGYRFKEPGETSD